MCELEHANRETLQVEEALQPGFRHRPRCTPAPYVRMPSGHRIAPFCSCQLCNAERHRLWREADAVNALAREGSVRAEGAAT